MDNWISTAQQPELAGVAGPWVRAGDYRGH
ncbi:hypothetical protein RCH17_001195 [Arthrobacter sp. MP_M7]|nr:hypothetical protein [Arthrobacter sp. MP_M4]MEC5202399.1 hypothetical protein [Arthrobacter sp. MP_M7]